MQLRCGQERVASPAGQPRHQLNVLRGPAAENEVRRASDFEVAMRWRVEQQRIEAEDDVLAGRLDVDQSIANPRGTERRGKPAQQIEAERAEPVDDEEGS